MADISFPAELELPSVSWGHYAFSSPSYYSTNQESARGSIMSSSSERQRIVRMSRGSSPAARSPIPTGDSGGSIRPGLRLYVLSSQNVAIKRYVYFSFEPS